MPCMANGVKVVCLANKSQPTCWLQIMNTMTSQVKCWLWMYWTNGPDNKQTSDDNDQLSAVICFLSKDHLMEFYCFENAVD